MDSPQPNFSAIADGDLPKPHKPILDRLPYDWLKLVALPFVVLLMLIVILGLPLAAIFVVSHLLFHSKNAANGSAMGLFVVVLVALTIYSGRRNKRKSSTVNVFQNFAQANSWKYGQLRVSDPNPLYTLLKLDTAGAYGATYMAVTGQYLGSDFQLVLGWHEQGTSGIENYELCLCFEVPKHVPDAVLFAVHSGHEENRPKALASFQTGYANPQAVSLEGDFNNYFRLYIPEGTQVAALSEIAPDVMEVAKQYSGSFDIQFAGSFMLLTPPAEAASKALIVELFTAMGAFLKAI